MNDDNQKRYMITKNHTNKDIQIGEKKLIIGQKIKHNYMHLGMRSEEEGTFFLPQLFALYEYQ